MKYRKDFYKVLGVDLHATHAEIVRAYRRLAVLNHPDRNPDPHANLLMQEINEAYSVLGNQRKRKEYDAAYSDLTGSIPSQRPVSDKVEVPAPATQLGSSLFADLLTSLRIAIPLLILGSLFYWTISRQNAQNTLPTLALVVIVSGLGFLFFKVEKYFRNEENESVCPNCKKPQAAQVISEKLLGVFNKGEYQLFLNQYGQRDEDHLIWYQRFQISYQCAYCKHEWVSLKSKKL